MIDLRNANIHKFPEINRDTKKSRVTSFCRSLMSYEADGFTINMWGVR